MIGKRSLGYRLLECLPGLLSWGVLLLPLVFLFIAPQVSIIFFLFYTLLWFFRAWYFSAVLLYSYGYYKKVEKYPWYRLSQHVFTKNHAELTAEEQKIYAPIIRELESKKSKDLHLEDIYHAVIIASYKEELPILRATFQALKDSYYDKKKIIAVLALEERDKDHALENLAALQQEFEGVFHSIHGFLHPKDTPGEVIGKGGNITHAARCLTPILEQDFQLAPEAVMVTTLDADHIVHPEYFAVLSAKFLTTDKPHHKTYQPLPLFYNNIWDVPTTNRLIAMSSSFWHLIESARPKHLRNFASQAQTLRALKDMDFWSTTTIVEDGHQYWRSYFHFQGEHKVIPLYIPIYQDAVQHCSYMTTVKGQYLQLRRWAYGASDVPFVITHFWKHRRELPFWKTLGSVLYLIQGHVLWATSALMLFLAGPLQFFLHYTFDEKVMIIHFTEILSALFTIALVGIIISMFISTITIPRPPKSPFLMKVIHALEWLLLPIITIIFGSFPAMEAQTRLLFGAYLDFNVTAKVRTTTKQTSE